MRGRDANVRPRPRGPAWPCWPPPRCWPWPRPRRPRPRSGAPPSPPVRHGPPGVPRWREQQRLSAATPPSSPTTIAPAPAAAAILAFHQRRSTPSSLGRRQRQAHRPLLDGTDVSVRLISLTHRVRDRRAPPRLAHASPVQDRGLADGLDHRSPTPAAPAMGHRRPIPINAHARRCHHRGSRSRPTCRPKRLYFGFDDDRDRPRDTLFEHRAAARLPPGPTPTTSLRGLHRPDPDMPPTTADLLGVSLSLYDLLLPMTGRHRMADRSGGRNGHRTNKTERARFAGLQLRNEFWTRHLASRVLTLKGCGHRATLARLAQDASDDSAITIVRARPSLWGRGHDSADVTR